MCSRHARGPLFPSISVVFIVCALGVLFSPGPRVWQMRRETIAAAPASAGGPAMDTPAGEGQVGNRGLLLGNEKLIFFYLDALISA